MHEPYGIGESRGAAPTTPCVPYPAGMTSPTDPGLPLRVAIVGCGNIAGPYATCIAAHDELELVAATDVDATRAAAFGEKHGCRVHESLQALLADPEIQLVVNLTVHHAHYAVTRQALEAGKHVYSEKPMALEAAEARELVELAARQGVRLACAPSTFLGEAQQTAGAIIANGELGTVRAVYADVNWGRIEAWHPAPIPFYDVGVLVDVGVYPLTIATAFIGPAVAVQALGWDLLPDRVTTAGEGFRIGSPDLIVAAVELTGGAIMRLTGSFYVGRPIREPGRLEFHGDAGSLALASFQDFDAPIERGSAGGEWEPVAYVREPFDGTDWGRGLADLARSIVDGTPQRVTGEHAAHVVEILSAARESMRDHRRVELASTFTPPPLMDWTVAAAAR
jgi:predicted dehydrogenase